MLNVVEIPTNNITLCYSCENHSFFMQTLRKSQVETYLRGNVQKKNSIFKDIIQTKVDHPPSYPNFDKLFFDNFLVGRAPTLPTEFLTKDSKENCILSIFMHEI